MTKEAKQDKARSWNPDKRPDASHWSFL